MLLKDKSFAFGFFFAEFFLIKGGGIVRIGLRDEVVADLNLNVEWRSFESRESGRDLRIEGERRKEVVADLDSLAGLGSSSSSSSSVAAAARRQRRVQKI